jgi:hypothetical protein
MAFQGLDLIWYGDSITYLLYQGSDRQQEWANYFGQYRSAVFGVPSEGLLSLRRRLINGGAPKARWLPITRRLYNVPGFICTCALRILWTSTLK